MALACHGATEMLKLPVRLRGEWSENRLAAVLVPCAQLRTDELPWLGESERAARSDCAPSMRAVRER